MTAEPAAAVRPRNRRQLIVEAGAAVFGERGYHAASMDEIAARVGITAAALYRHFPNKYALFAACANVMADRLVAALAEVAPDASLAEIFAAVTRVTVAHRETGGVYRWEARYLEREDRRLLAGKFADVVERVAAAVRREHPWPGEHLRAVAALGAIGSVTTHHNAMAQRRVGELLRAAALRVAATGPAAAHAPLVEIPAPPVPRTRRSEILAAAVPLFERDGFATVTNGRIAEAVGLVPSALYRYFPGKADILAAACLQAAGLLAQAVEHNLRGTTDPHGALSALTATYVAYSFEHSALNSVANAEIAGLPDGLRRPLVAAQREHIAVWEQHLREARPDLDARQARVLVHAGFGVVVEAGRRLRWADRPEHRAAVAALLVSALGL
ncbi:TetR family transcriptional regulator [Amycolatopsis mediterranei S699]|uniref:TetR family transcriptional regulator n=4 Tax=Amycolatopsis mediterranei TaxID=33910 RepID=A0A0H3D2B0_AMYMU|nr:TetR/AcrR family transcriptional regulator [Amycolatopsis mediterranei]ADJ45089.1 TetR family transcriptional regulator [Amycolatopsis mediterranei U32]AEK41846.1 TetR family transcriptional regulator [Amycolatopsis mediterranei S699]AFO76800.1 TetR family transcriptional regulator [Amycolatopsis mediterranei S699]AGT83928.1 TetR family transcriptional regulator [Amycolatopsis mediterranei RB]KDO08729.1 TetR family transcriptional regulator [Amycolatopsis mediterranei]